jgi:hypothetical protein
MNFSARACGENLPACSVRFYVRGHADQSRHRRRAGKGQSFDSIANLLHKGFAAQDCLPLDRFQGLSILPERDPGWTMQTVV